MRWLGRGDAKASTSARADTPAGPALYRAVVAALAAMAYPPALDYDVVVTVVSGGRTRSDRYAGHVHPPSGTFRVATFSQAETARPYVPHGINVTYSFGVGIASGARPVAQTGDGQSVHAGGLLTHVPPLEAYAIPELSPIYAFGLRPCAEHPKVTRPDRGSGQFQTIGATTTTSIPYDVRVAGSEMVDGQPAIHLALVALREPHANRLRDLWIDPASHAPLQARIRGNFTDSGDARADWLIRFATFEGATIIASEIAEAPVQRGRTTYERVDISFEHIVRSPDISDLDFALPPHFDGLDVIVEPACP